MSFALVVLLSAPAHAGGCDVKSLTKAVADATPGQAGQAFLDLAACDKNAAKSNASVAFAKILPGPAAEKAVLMALQLGVPDAVRSWIGLMQPDEKSAYINTLGRTCDKPEIPAFFVDTAKNATSSFWSDRYYAGLDECRTTEVAALLEGFLSTPDGDRSRYEGVLNTYARNQGAKAIPKITEWLKVQTDPYLATFLVTSYSDAANVGSMDGMDAAAAQQAIAAIKEVAPTMPQDAIEGARKTMQSLGAEDEADKLVVQRYRDVAVNGSTLQYGMYVVKAATCKKGDTKIEIHSALVVDAGHTWPDTLASRLAPVVDKLTWHLPKDCEGSPELIVTQSPLKDAAAYDAWLKTQDTELLKKYAGAKPKTYSESGVQI